MKNLDETPEIEVYCNRIHHEIKHGISHEKEDSTSIYIQYVLLVSWLTPVPGQKCQCGSNILTANNG